MLSLRFALLLLLVFYINGCIQPEERLDTSLVVNNPLRSQEEDVAAIRLNLQRFVRADIDGDSDTLSYYLVDNVVWMPPESSVVVGKNAVLYYLNQNRAPSTLRVTPITIDVSGHLASLRGTFEIRIDNTRVTGKMAQQWRREHSEWRIVWDIWNLDSSEM